MSERLPPDQTADLPVADGHLDAGLAAAFGPDSGPPLPAGGSVVRALGAASRIHLRDPEGEALTPVARPGSENMPVSHDSASRLQLHGEIARGGMGAVLKGRDTDLCRDLAVKVLLETHQGKTELVQRFVEEAQITGQLQHPGIAPVYELGQFADKRPYFTMKLVKGKTLAALLAARKEPAEERSKFVGIFAQVCQTLAYAHARGVIHRDLKPANVMVGAFGEVQVMDWGLAKVLAEGGVADEEKAQQHHTVSVIRTQRSLGSSAPEGIGSHTVAGSMLGTPAYMAPEQARGEVELIDERADVFGLGAILCEILTGQPPYTGKKAEVQRKAQTASLDDASTRLDGCGAEAELIGQAKRCLAAEPWDRPRDAGQVAAAVAAYQNSVAERLRQAELAQAAEAARAEEAQATAAEAEAKARVERRSRRLTLALAASVLLAGVLGAAGWRWVELDRIGRAAARDARVNAALQEAVRLRGQAQGAAVEDLASRAEAVAAAKKAEALLEPGVDPALRQQVDTLLAEVTAEERRAREMARAVERDRVLLDRLHEIRSANATDPDGTATDAHYAEAFREAGIDVTVLPPAEAGAMLRDRPTAVALAAMLDYWAAVRRDKRKDAAGAKRLIEVAQVADSDPRRREFRAAVEQTDKDTRLAVLRSLSQTARLDELGAVSLDLLGNELRYAGDAAAAEKVLRAVQLRYPGDFWVNSDLAGLLEMLGRRGEAIRYYMAARALRPETAFELALTLEKNGELDAAILVYENLVRLRPKNGNNLTRLGRALQARGRGQEARAVLDAAVDAYRDAIRQNPDSAQAHIVLGNVLREQERVEEAIQEFREALRLSPTSATAHNSLGLALWKMGLLDEALQEYREALRLDPKLNVQWILRRIMIKQGRGEEVRDAWQKALEANPPEHSAWFGYAELCLFLGQEEEYRRACRALVDRFGASAVQNTAERIGRTCLLLPGSEDELRQATVLIDRAVAALESTPAVYKPWILHAKGLAEYRAGRMDSAIALMTGEASRLPWPSVRLVLAMAQHRQGQKEVARKTLATATLSYKWTAGNANMHDDWIAHVLRREAEALILPDLPAFLQGNYLPRDNDERAAFLGVCQFKALHATTARLYADIFAADAQLADDLKAQHRYNAACYAVLAAAGQGAEAAKLDEKERTTFRRQALEWLWADLRLYAKQVESNQSMVAVRLRSWQRDSDLASLRYPDAITKLPAEEREACRKLWAEVEELLRKAEAKK
jgi:serine/threonine-protein kinase